MTRRPTRSDAGRPPIDRGPIDRAAMALLPAAEVIAAHAAAQPRLAQRPEAAVVVPIYSGGPTLEACLDALATHNADAQIVLVDDSGGDPEVEASCESFLDRLANSKLVVNERNLGFVSSANAGMAAADADRDVVLLNSDTVVTGRWLEKLSVAAYVFDDIATVVPLSNAADVFSLPEDRTDNPLPAGWSPDLCARVLEQVAPRMYEEVPATSGFCQYVRRAAIEVVGRFDSLLFLRGYGEDNDFCERASAAGFRHLIDDSTFIFHERTVSFAERRQGLSKINKAVLKALHPDHVRVCVEWEAGSRLGEVRRAYADALEALGSVEVAALEQALRLTPTKLTVSDAASSQPRAESNGGSRGIGVILGESGVDVEFLGGARLSAPDGFDRDGFLSWLINRCGVTDLEVLDGAIDQAAETGLRAAWRL